MIPHRWSYLPLEKLMLLSLSRRKYWNYVLGISSM
jgi:hypothetical protein